MIVGTNWPSAGLEGSAEIRRLLHFISSLVLSIEPSYLHVSPIQLAMSEFGFSSRYFIIHARRLQSHFHFSCRVPGLAGHFPMPSVDTLSPLISVSSSCIYKDSFLC
jgi:hypothetical protein